MPNRERGVFWKTTATCWGNSAKEQGEIALVVGWRGIEG